MCAYPRYPPYVNRWIAVARGRVIGAGVDAAQAYRAAKSVCAKDRPVLFFVDESGMAFPQPQRFDNWFQHDILAQVTYFWQQQGQTGYLVGGAVRDGLKGRLDYNADLDLLVPQNALQVARSLADAMGAAYYPVDPKRHVGRVVFPDQRQIDIAAFRGPSLEADLRDRDFTINAIALTLTLGAPHLIDPLGGQDDLKNQIIRVASSSAIQNDHLRAVRGVRLAARLGFELEPNTRKLIVAGAPGLVSVSPERMREEVMKLLQTAQPGRAVAMLRELELLPYMLPETEAMVGVAQSPPHRLAVFEHTLAVMDAWPRLVAFDDPRLARLKPLNPQLNTYFQTQLPGNLTRASLMPLAALLHDIGKPATVQQGSDGRIHFWRHPQVGADIARQILYRWRFSKGATQFVLAIVRNHMRPLLLANQQSVSKRAIHRFLQATGDAAPAVAIFSLIDHLGIYGPEQGESAWNRLMAVVLQICQVYFAPRPVRLLTGKEVMQHLNLSSGPEIGRLLKMLAEAQLVGEVSTREEALTFIAAKFKD